MISWHFDHIRLDTYFVFPNSSASVSSLFTACNFKVVVQSFLVTSSDKQTSHVLPGTK